MLSSGIYRLLLVKWNHLMMLPMLYGTLSAKASGLCSPGRPKKHRAADPTLGSPVGQPGDLPALGGLHARQQEQEGGPEAQQHQHPPPQAHQDEHGSPQRVVAHCTPVMRHGVTPSPWHKLTM